MQVPLQQAWLEGQAFPHEPQFFGSPPVSVQVPAQAVWPG
jgi:hypothetical protein